MRAIIIAAAMTVGTTAGVAYGQAQGPGSGPGMSNPMEPMEQRGLDERFNDFNRMRDMAGPPRSSRPVPAGPNDIKPQSEVRDSRGAIVGMITSVKDGFAVLSSPIGRVEVEFSSFAKNNKGLLINMPKSKIEKLMAGKF